jgi:para-nitrobenzyl esterase
LAAFCAFTLGPVVTASAKTASYPEPFAIAQSGVVLGTTVNGVDEFLGIPYATPPVGPLRWLPPEAFGEFAGGTFEATQFGNECTQPGPTGSEDCLYLNVYTPSGSEPGNAVEQAGDETTAASKKPSGLPVMVWIHGGGLTAGGGDLYDPTPLVNQGGVIVVTINYRLGVLGFLAQAALDSEGHERGNYGLMDQQLALKWVQENIKAFGGDPKKATMFGESAGGQSVYCNLASPTAKHLFRGAIAESGSYTDFQDYFPAIVPIETAETTDGFAPSGSSVAISVGCSSHDEYRYFVAGEYDLAGNPILTFGEYADAVTALWTTELEPYVLEYYPYASYPSGDLALAASGTDGVFSCPARNADLLLSKFVKTYAYEFNDENAPPGTVTGVSFPLGAFHGAEIQYLMLVTGDVFPFTTDQQALSDAMISYWTQFAKTGNPNSANEPTWPKYSKSADEFQSLVPPAPMVESSFNAFHQCDSFWNLF